MQGGRQLAGERTQADTWNDWALWSRKVPWVERTVTVPGRDYWRHLLLPAWGEVKIATTKGDIFILMFGNNFL